MKESVVAGISEISLSIVIVAKKIISFFEITVDALQEQSRV